MDDATLIGYLLHALDAESHRRVEAYLLSRPESWGRVARLRRTLLAPLADDADPPPPRLAVRTLARLADARRLPDAPPPAPGEAEGGPRGWCRRADVLLGLLLLPLLLLLAAPWLCGQRRQARSCLHRLALAERGAGQRAEAAVRGTAAPLPPDGTPLPPQAGAPHWAAVVPLWTVRPESSADPWLYVPPTAAVAAEEGDAFAVEDGGQTVLYADGHVRRLPSGFAPGRPAAEGTWMFNGERTD